MTSQQLISAMPLLRSADLGGVASLAEYIAKLADMLTILDEEENNKKVEIFRLSRTLDNLFYYDRQEETAEDVSAIASSINADKRFLIDFLKAYEEGSMEISGSQFEIFGSDTDYLSAVNVPALKQEMIDLSKDGSNILSASVYFYGKIANKIVTDTSTEKNQDVIKRARKLKATSLSVLLTIRENLQTTKENFENASLILIKLGQEAMTFEEFDAMADDDKLIWYNE